MKISVSNHRDSIPISETEQFKYLKDCGFDAVDFSLIKYFDRGGIFGDIDSVTDDMIKEHFTMLKKHADEAGIEIGQTHSAFGGHPREYDGDIEEIIKREIASIKATHWLGCKYCVMHPVINRKRYYEYFVGESYAQTKEYYRRFIPVLQEYDVYCCFENMWMVDPVYNNICSTIFSHASEMIKMANELGERFKICVDIGHAPLTLDDPAEMILTAGDRLAVIHAHDNDGISDLHTFPYCATQAPESTSWKPFKIDWDKIMDALDTVNYKGNLNFEMTPPGPDEVKTAGFEYLAAIGRFLASKRKIQY